MNDEKSMPGWASECIHCANLFKDCKVNFEEIKLNGCIRFEREGDRDAEKRRELVPGES